MAPNDTKTDDAGRIRDVEVEAARWQAILRSARDAIVGIDHRGVVTVFNPAAEAMFGYTAAEMRGNRIDALMAPFDRERHDSYIRDYERTGEAKAIGRVRRLEARRKNGEIFPMELSVSEARVGDQALYSAIIRDVTERAQAEEIIRIQGRQQAQIAGLGLVALRGAGLETVMDRAAAAVIETLGVEFCKILELDDARTTFVVRAGVGWRDGIVGHARVSAGRDSQAGYTLACREPVTVDDFAAETRFAAPALLRDHGIVSGMSVLIHGGAEPFGVLGAHTARRRHFAADDTHFLQAVANVLATSIERARGEVEVRRLQELARQRERLADLGAIAAQVVHEVGNPVAALSLQAELLQRRLGRDVAAAPKSVTGPAASIVAEIRRLERLVGDFKDFARQQRLDLASIDVARFLAAVADLWRPMAAAHRIDLTMRPGPALPAVMADEDKLHRVLDNLLKNAVEAIGKGPGAIGLEATLLTRERLRISVSDTGAGLREGKATFRLFETTKPGGTGLGLSIARQIVLAHGGDLIGEPAVPHGTVFHIELPVRTPESP